MAMHFNYCTINLPIAQQAGSAGVLYKVFALKTIWEKEPDELRHCTKHNVGGTQDRISGHAC